MLLKWKILYATHQAVKTDFIFILFKKFSIYKKENYQTNVKCYL